MVHWVARAVHVPAWAQRGTSACAMAAVPGDRPAQLEKPADQAEHTKPPSARVRQER